MDETTFRRYLHETADQLGPSDLQKLPNVLQGRLPLPSAAAADLTSSFESLFKGLVEQSFISSHDIVLLQGILEDLGRGYLLYPFYEAHSHSNKTADTPHTRKTSTSDFLILLIQIGHQLSQENVRTLCYLLQDLLTRYKASSLQDGVEIFEIIRQRQFISCSHPCFLLTLLKDIDREDMCHMVDEYRMANPAELTPAVDHGNESTAASKQHPCSSFFSYFKKKSEEEKMTWTRREYRFRLAMKKMADKLNPRDLDNMKLLSQSVLPAAMLERVDTILELLWLLEDHGQLSIDNLYFLEELLDDKSYLLDAIYSQLSHSSSQPNSRENSLTRRIKNKISRGGTGGTKDESTARSFQKMLKLVGTGLTQKETKHLKILTDTTSNTDKIKTGVELISHWQKYRLVTQINLDLLRKSLYAIGRQDLCQHISLYHCALQLTEDHRQGTSLQPPVQETTYKHSNTTQNLSSGVEDLPPPPVTAQQCTDDFYHMTDRDLAIQLRQKELKIQRQKEELTDLQATLHQFKQHYKELEYQNHNLLLHNHELTVELTEQCQLNISTLTRSASKNGIFLSTPV